MFYYAISSFRCANVTSGIYYGSKGDSFLSGESIEDYFCFFLLAFVTLLLRLDFAFVDLVGVGDSDIAAVVPEGVLAYCS